MDTTAGMAEVCMRNPLWGLIAKTAEETSERVALRVVAADGSEGGPVTYTSLCSGGLAAAAFLSGLGVSEGGIVLTAVANTEAYLSLSIGVARLGAVWAPADPELSLDQLLRLFGIYEPAVAFLTDIHVDAVAVSDQVGQDIIRRILKVPSWQTLLAHEGPLPAETPIDDDAAATMMLTSGTTGFPKSVMTPTSFLRKWANLDMLPPKSEASETLVYFGCPAWVSYLFMFLHTVSSGKTFVLGQGYTKDLFFEAVARHQPPTLFFWPEVVVDFVTLPQQMQHRISSFAKTLMYGGARTPPAALLKLIRALPDTTITQAYGSTEMGLVSQLSADDHAAAGRDAVDERAMRRLESAGKCVGQVRVVDEQGEPTPAGVTGSIQLHPPSSGGFKGYYKNPEATAAKWTMDGWFITGDLGRLDRDGYLYLDGRDSETIVLLSGANVYPSDIENVLSELPDIIEVAVAKVVAGDSAISEVGAFVRVAEGAKLSVADVQAQCRRRLGQPRSHPTHIFIQTEKLPRNKNGKPLKNLLTAQADAALRKSALVGGA